MKVVKAGTFFFSGSVAMAPGFFAHLDNWAFELEPGDVVPGPEELQRENLRLALKYMADSAGIEVGNPLVKRPPAQLVALRPAAPEVALGGADV